MKKTTEKMKGFTFPEGAFCGHNCAEGCRYWDPYKKDSNGRSYCCHYDSFYYPHERQGCLSFER